MDKSNATKKLLIKSALEVLCKTSYRNTQLQDVAKAVGLSRGAIYWNFKNKLDLYDQVFTESFEVGMKGLYDILKQEGSVIDIVSNAVEHLLGERIKIHHQSALLYNGLKLESPEGIEQIIVRVDKLFTKLFNKHQQLLERGIDEGELNPKCNAKLETRVLYNFLWGYFTNKERFFSDYSPEELKEYVLMKFVNPLKSND